MKKAVILALAAIMVIGVGAAAFAGSANYVSVPPATALDGGPVVVQARVNPKINLTVSTTDGVGLLLDWATAPLNPGDDPAAKSVTLTVDSNKDFGITVTDNLGDFTAAGLTFTRLLTPGVNGYAKGAGRTFTDQLNFGPISWDIAPGIYTGSIAYTVIQNP